MFVILSEAKDLAREQKVSPIRSPDASLHFVALQRHNILFF